MLKIILKTIIKLTLSFPVNYLLNKYNFFIIFRHGSAIGDHVYLSSVIREIKIKHNKKILLFTNYYFLYFNNPRIYKLFKFDYGSFIWSILNCLKGDAVFEFRSEKDNSKFKHFIFFHSNTRMHISQAVSEHLKLKIDYSSLKNEFFFSKSEVNSYEKNILLPKNFSVIQSTTKKTYTDNKEWSVEGMQIIVNSFPEINWIQVGKSTEPKLKNCKYYLDSDLRLAAYIISKCEFIVCYEGLFNHLASCFEKKCFLIHTGFLHIDCINYKNNIVIHKNSSMSCYPCYDLECPTHNKEIVEKLDQEYVINIIKSNLINKYEKKNQ